MKVQVRQFVGVGPIVDLAGTQGDLDGLGRVCDVFAVQREFQLWQFEEFIDVAAVGDDATAGVGLLFE